MVDLEVVEVPSPEAKNPDGSDGIKSGDLNVLIATPMYGGLSYASYARSIRALTDTFRAYGVRHQVLELTNESLIPRGRNTFANIVALDKDPAGEDYSHLLFIDADIGFNPMNIMQALGWNKDIVALGYPAKDIDWNKIVRAIKNGVEDPVLLARMGSRPIINTNQDDTTFDIFKPIQFPQLGTGILAINRRVLVKFTEDLSRRYKLMDGEQKSYKREYAYDFFKCGIDAKTRYYNSEDYQFCIDATEMGFETWLLPWAITSHTGPYEFWLDMPAQAANNVHVVGFQPVEDSSAKEAAQPSEQIQSL